MVGDNMPNLVYNNGFIADFSESEYMKYLSNTSMLDSLCRTYSLRFNDKMNIDGFKVLFKESLDHFIVKKVMIEKSFIRTIQFKNYLNYLKKMALVQTEICTNVFFNCFNNQLDALLDSLFGKKDADTIKNIRKDTFDKLKRIKYKIEKGISLNQMELDYYCVYFANSRVYSEDYRKLISFIFSNLYYNKNLKCSYQVLVAILNFLPYEYPRENGFDPTSVRFTITDFDMFGKYNKSIASSLGDRPIIQFNRKIFKNIDFTSIDDAKRKTYTKTYNDFTSLLMVAYHELTHQFQWYMSGKKEISDEGLMYVISMVLDNTLNDYNRNHDSDQIEIHATAKSWKVCANFYKKYLNIPIASTLCNICYNNTNGTNERRAVALKIDNAGVTSYKGRYDINYMNTAVRCNLSYIRRFPVLSKLYSDDGYLRNDVLKIHGLSISSVGIDYIKYILRNGFWMEMMRNFSNYSDYELSSIVDNIYYALKDDLDMLELLNYNKRLNLADEANNKLNTEQAKTAILKEFCSNYSALIQIYDIIRRHGRKSVNERIQKYRYMLENAIDEYIPSMQLNRRKRK